MKRLEGEKQTKNALPSQVKMGSHQQMGTGSTFPKGGRGLGQVLHLQGSAEHLCKVAGQKSSGAQARCGQWLLKSKSADSSNQDSLTGTMGWEEA